MMKLSKNGIKVLKAQYRSVLLKCLAINAGLFMAAAPAMAINGHNYGNTDLIISADTYPEGVTNPAQGGVHEYDEEEHQDAYNYKSITVDGSKLTVENNFKLRSGSGVVLNKGEIKVSDSSLKAQGDYFEVKGGKLTVTGNGQYDVELNSQGIKISGGEVNLTGAIDFTNDNSEREFSVSDGKVVINGGGVVIGSNEDCAGTECTAGKFEMTGGELVVNNGAAKDDSDFNSNYLEGAEINIKGGALTISQNAYLQTVSGMIVDEMDDPIELYQGTINLTDEGIINLAGTLYANIDGNGTIRLNDSDAQINGNIAGVDIMVEKDINFTDLLNGKITDTLGNLTVNSGTLQMENVANIEGSDDDNENTQYLAINGLTVAKDAALSVVATNMMTTAKESVQDDVVIRGTLELEKSVLESGNDNTETANNSDMLFSGASVTANYSDIEANGNIIMDGTDFQAKGNNDSALNPQDVEGMWADGYISISSSTINLEKSYIASEQAVVLTDTKVTGKDALITADGELQINGGELILSSDVDYGDENMPNGHHMAGTTHVLQGGEVNLFDTKLKLTDTSIRATDHFDMQGGELTLITTQPDHAATLWGYNGIEISGATVNLISETDEDGPNITTLILDETHQPGRIYINDGAVINIQGNAMFGSAGIIRMEGDNTTINIAENSFLDLVGNMREDGHTDHDAVATLQLSGGIINLAGEICGNIDGNDKGEIVFKNSNALIDGNVESPSLTFAADHSLSKAITGEIGSLDKLTIAKGTLNFDKPNAGNHGITTVEVANGATLDIGVNTLYSSGDREDGEGVFFKDNSTLKFTATSADEHGQIKANYVNISENGTTLNMILNGAALDKGQSMTVRLFDEAEENQEVEIDGKFAKLQNNARYKFVDNGDGSYTVTAEESASDVIDDTPTGGDDTPTGGDDTPTGGDDTPTGGDDDGSSSAGNREIDNNKQTAEAWDHFDTAQSNSQKAVEIAQGLAELSNKADTKEGKKAYRDALTSLAPETAPVVQQSQSQISNQVFSTVSTRLSGGSAANVNRGMASGDGAEDAALWLQGMLNKAKYDASTTTEFDSDTWGTAIGLEKYFSPAFKMGVGYAYSKSDIEGFKRDTDVKTHTALVYGEYKPNNWYANMIVSYGWSDYEETKHSVADVKADYDVDALAVQAMTGYDIRSASGLILTPETGVRYIHMKQDAYTDTAGQRVDSSDNDLLTGVVGATLSKRYRIINSNVRLTPELRVAATYDLARDNTDATVTLPNGSSYKISGEAMERFGVEMGAGVTADLSTALELSLGYEGRFKKDYQEHSGLVNAKFKF